MTRELNEGDLLEGKYRVLRRIGEGGMGVVYEAEHVLLERRVAVKVLHPVDASDPSMLARFKAEAQAAANTRHPNIVEVMDFGVTPDGLSFFVMEYLTGESLAARIDRYRRLPEREVVEIVDQILTGLARAHQAGVVHRDLKPENIFLTRVDDYREVVKILDFGISKLVTPRGGGDRLALSGKPETQAGIVLGTPGYIAPEAVFGLRQVDARADLFSVGVILFEAMCGRRPFRGDNPHDILLATTSSPVPRPTSLRPDMSEPMERLILTALAKEPDERFQTAEEFLRFLTAAAVGRLPESARPCKTKVGIPSMPPPDVSVLGPTITAEGPPIEIVRASPARAPVRTQASRETRPRPVPVVGPPPRAPARRAMLPITPLGAVLLLGLAGTAYYLFVYQNPLVVASTADPLTSEIRERGAESHRIRAVEEPADTGAAATAPAPKDRASTVTIWLDMRPNDATVLWNGRPMSERPLIVPSGTEPSALVASAPGYFDERVTVIPDKEQTLTVRLKPKKPEPRPKARKR
ncbi:MAG: serine/threonine-protein kinase [Deltaproteobacteria bacterium]|nr:serine/threonine-protein kinase [Deltaproteobacteria bacterium]